MNEAQTPSPSVPEFDEADIAAYLVAHPEFARRYPEAFEAQDVSHVVEGATSLIERQVAVLRKTNRDLAERFESLVTTARANEERVIELNRVARIMVGATETNTLVDALTTCLKSHLSVDRVYVGLTGDLPDGIEKIDRLVEDGRIGQALTNVFRRGKPILGDISAAQAAALFDADDNALPTSAAFVPLGSHRVAGVIVLASSNPQRFTADMGTMFVALFGELLTATLNRLLGSDVIA